LAEAKKQHQGAISKMNIAFVTSELVPYSKTGGLADVSGALPPEIAALGHKVSVFAPYYRATRKLDPKAKIIAEGTVPVGNETVPWTLHAASANKGDAKVYFIGCDAYFDRDGLYGTPQGDYEDSCSRFVFFCRATLSAAQALGERVDIWHCNDWQTALIPVYLKVLFANHAYHGGASSVLAIHNIAYQGLFWHGTGRC
jgi:starch synthase